MRILHILASLRASGAEQMLRVAAPYWRAAGLDMDVLEVSLSPGHFGNELEAAGYTVLEFPAIRTAAHVRPLRDLIRAGGYDVVHIHPESADVIPGLASRLAGVPAVFRTVHHIYLYEGLLRYRKRSERKLNRALGTRYLTNSRSGFLNERERLGNPTQLIYNWYDDGHFRPPTPEQRSQARSSLGLDADDVIFVSVGGCSWYKNHGLILRALASVPGGRYVHAGPELNDEERRLAASLGVGDRAHFLGVVPDTREVYHAADVYVMPSDSEGFGIAAIEAMACGIPTILSDRPSLWDLKGLVPGLWVPLDIEALALAMRRMAFTSREQRRVDGYRASQVVGGLFSVERGADGYLNAYREALGQ